MSPGRVCTIIAACGVLHNIAIYDNEPEDEDEEPLDLRNNYGGPATGQAVRNHIRNIFDSSLRYILLEASFDE